MKAALLTEKAEAVAIRAAAIAIFMVVVTVLGGWIASSLLLDTSVRPTVEKARGVGRRSWSDLLHRRT